MYTNFKEGYNYNQMDRTDNVLYEQFQNCLKEYIKEKTNYHNFLSVKNYDKYGVNSPKISYTDKCIELNHSLLKEIFLLSNSTGSIINRNDWIEFSKTEKASEYYFIVLENLFYVFGKYFFFNKKRSEIMEVFNSFAAENKIYIFENPDEKFDIVKNMYEYFLPYIELENKDEMMGIKTNVFGELSLLSN